MEKEIIMKSCLLYLILSLTSVICLQCAGGGTDVESSGGRLTGSIVDSKGMIAVNTYVRLISQTSSPFDKDTIYSTIVNDSGNYSFAGIDSGVYNLEAVNHHNGTRLLLQRIHIFADQETKQGTGTLQIPGSIIIVCDSQDIAGKSFLFVPGTSILKQLSSSTDSIEIDSVPAGTIPPIYYADVNGEKQTPVTDTLHLLPGETLKVVAYDNWEYSQNIYFNASGASVNGAVNFPLLIRLDKTNFDFSKAATNGKDLRFTRSGTISLPYEIEQWDSLETTASIWVLLDTIDPNSSSEFITMYWGNPNAKKVSSGPSVFGTDNGFFRAVLHINQESSGVKNHGLYQDATGLTNDGDDNISDRGRDGIIGYGKHFDFSKEDFILIDTIKSCSFGEDPFTISLWFKADYKQSSNLFTWYFGETDTVPLGVSLDSIGTISVWYNKETLLTAAMPFVNVWTHLAITRSATRELTLYIDGTATKTVSFPNGISTKASGMLFIGSEINVYSGTNPLSRSFNGFIDEFRVEGKERSAEYIMLQYLSQQLTPFVSFGDVIDN
jgi:hypothetical protein